MKRLRSRLFKVCPKTGRIVGVRVLRDVPRFLFPVVGLMALAWFLLRVAPKPSRAAYPCQKVAAPLAGSFLVWLAGITGASIAFRQARTRMRQARYVAAGLALVVAVAGIGWAVLNLRQPAQAAPVAYTAHTPNSPIGVAKGLKPGRVAWIHDPQVTDNWGGTASSASNAWYTHINQGEATNMMGWALTGYADTTTPAAAWDAIFRNFNGGAAYQPGEKVFIKVNLTTSNSGCGGTDYSWTISCLGTSPASAGWANVGQSPQLMLALLDQLVNVVGVAQTDITIGDSTGLWVNELHNILHGSFPNVVYMDARGTAGSGRTKATRSTVPLYWSAPPSETKDMNPDYLLQPVVAAKYLINFAVLKSHERNGITATAKNHFGSLSGGNNVSGDPGDQDERKPTTTGYYNLHDRLPLESQSSTRFADRASMAQYRPLVDLNGNAGMGGKTLLYMLDGIYAGKGWAGTPSKWGVLPFCNTPACATSDKFWPASLFLSMDQVAIDSVAFDFLSLRAADWPEVLAAEGVQDYLHEMALANNPPSHIVHNTVYDPEHDGVAMASQGVHEHWNNATDKKYSRNLGTGNGIELLYMPKNVSIGKTALPIIVDGAVDAAWAGTAVQTLNNIVLGATTVSGPNDLSASYRALYDDTNLYLLVDVTDDVLEKDSSVWYDDDTVEIMIDGNYSRGTIYDGENDFEMGFRWNDELITRGANSAPNPPGAQFKIVGIGTGYRLEVKLPLAELGISSAHGRLFGLDVHVCDDDDGGARDAKIAWKAQVDDSWQYPYRLGAGRLVGLAPESIAACTSDTTNTVSWMNQYNLSVLDDLQGPFNETEGRTFVGNNFTHTGSSSFAIAMPTSTACSDRTFVVAGSIVAGTPLNVNHGSLAYGVTVNDRIVSFNGGTGCGLIEDTTLSDAAITTHVTNASASLAAATPNNADPTVDGSGNLVFNVSTTDANGLAVFDVTAAQVFANPAVSSLINFDDTANATTILINVSGTTMNWTNGQLGTFLASGSANISKVIWNFHQATSISTNTRRFAGALLAPLANVDPASGNLEGSAVVRNLLSAGEIHLPVFGLTNTPPLTGVCGSISVDYGDAPDTGAGTGTGNYNTLATDNGPSHLIVANLQLGANVPDADDGTLQNTAATADDTTGTPDDEDGVTTLPTILTMSTSVALSVSVLNTTGSPATLACWIDFNLDGVFSASELTSTTVNSLAGQQEINLTLTGFGTPVAGTSYLRCRLATAAGEVTNPTGAANTGEVEDYQVTIGTADYGDLPDTGNNPSTGPNNYQTLLADNGPRHTIVTTGPYLGLPTPDVDPDGWQSANADGDDTHLTPNDEDGVTIATGGNGIGWSNGNVTDTPVKHGGAVQVVINRASACLGASIDFNNDGILEVVTLLDSTGAAISQPFPVSTGTTYYFDIPENAFPGTDGNPVFFARFRVTSPVSGDCTSSPARSATGPAPDGEVEDYKWLFTPTAVTVGSLQAKTLTPVEAVLELLRMLAQPASR